MKGYDIGSKIQARDSNKVKAKLGDKIGTIKPYTGSARDFELANSGDVREVVLDLLGKPMMENGEVVKRYVSRYQPRDLDVRRIVTVDFGSYTRTMFLDRVHRYYKLAD